MRISLIGMAGSGKTYWSMKLAELGFWRFCCDDLIAAKLAPELTRADGTSRGLAEWMGFPYESQYRERESRYLDYEIEVLNRILGEIESLEERPEEKMVIDTTGSVIYTGEEILGKLRRSTAVVHLSTPPEVKERMLELYLANRRPVLWQGMYDQGPGETADVALAHCYPKLLSTRERQYEQLADVTVSYEERNRDGFWVDDLVAIIGASASG